MASKELIRKRLDSIGRAVAVLQAEVLVTSDPDRLAELNEDVKLLLAEVKKNDDDLDILEDTQ